MLTSEAILVLDSQLRLAKKVCRPAMRPPVWLVLPVAPRGVGYMALNTSCKSQQAWVGDKCCFVVPSSSHTAPHQKRLSKRSSVIAVVGCPHPLAAQLDLLHRMEKHLQLAQGARGHKGCSTEDVVVQSQ